MGYPETLEVLARLHVDARFREAWLQDAQAALAPYALTPREREGLAGADALVVERAGRMLDGHRLSRVHEHLPWADPSLRPGLLPVLKDFESFQYPVTELLAALAQPGWPEVPVRPTRVEYLKVPGLPAVLVRA